MTSAPGKRDWPVEMEKKRWLVAQVQRGRGQERKVPVGGKPLAVAKDAVYPRVSVDGYPVLPELLQAMPRSVNQFVQDLARLKREKATSGLLRALTEPFQFLFAKSSTFGSRLILVVWLHGRQEGPNWADDVWPQLRVAASDCI